MNTTAQITARLDDLVHRRNRELIFDAALKAVLGFGFTLVTFGVLWWMGWFLGWALGWPFGLYPWQCGILFSGMFFVAAVWSAWRRVDPLKGLKPLTDEARLMILIGHAAGYAVFSPRHATAGAAIVLLGGPAGVFEALGIWAHRIRADTALLESAAELLASCQAELPVKQIEAPEAALLLRRLALIIVVPRGETKTLMLTDKGASLLSRRKRSAR